MFQMSTLNIRFVFATRVLDGSSNMFPEGRSLQLDFVRLEICHVCLLFMLLIVDCSVHSCNDNRMFNPT